MRNGSEKNNKKKFHKNSFPRSANKLENPNEVEIFLGNIND